MSASAAGGDCFPPNEWAAVGRHETSGPTNAVGGGVYEGGKAIMEIQRIRVELDEQAVELLSKRIANLGLERALVWVAPRGGHRSGDITRNSGGDAVWQFEGIPRSWEIDLVEGAELRAELLTQAVRVVKGLEVLACASNREVAVRVSVLGGELRVNAMP